MSEIFLVVGFIKKIIKKFKKVALVIQFYLFFDNPLKLRISYLMFLMLYVV